MSDVVIVNSGVANLASITSAFRRLGAGVDVTDDSGLVAAARRVVLPGVGAFGAGLAALRARGLDRAVADAVARNTPLLGVCLGMQMLCEGSEETPGVAGLGVIAGGCRRLPDDVRVPHLGWNAVTAVSQVGLVDSGVAAFANSYALRAAPPGWTPAWTTHGVRFIAALERGRILACQFHPDEHRKAAERIRKARQQRLGMIEIGVHLRPVAAAERRACIRCEREEARDVVFEAGVANHPPGLLGKRVGARPMTLLGRKQ